MMHQFEEHVRIDCQEVFRHGRQEDPRFLRIYEGMQASFGNRQCAQNVCLHEAAHAVLMEQDGLRNVRFYGPTVYYDEGTDSFSAAGAGVRADDMPERQVDAAFVFEMTTQMAAGGVALREIGNVEGRVGDDHDYQEFLRMYLNDRITPPNLRRGTPEEFWERAQQAASARLGDGNTRERVLAKQAEYLRQL